MLTTLTQLPDELILLILSYCDIPDLLSLSRTTQHLRFLSFDHILHAQRLFLAALNLAHVFPNRPAYSSLSPPISTIILTPTHVLARTLCRQLVSIKLNRSFSRRPSATDLVNHNILPQECCKRVAGTTEMMFGGSVAPAILTVKRRIEKEKLKDGLRAYLERKAETVYRQSKREEARVPQSVTGLVRKFTAARSPKIFHGVDDGREYAQSKWGRKGWKVQQEKLAREPARAKVWALRRFWESGASKSVAIAV